MSAVALNAYTPSARPVRARFVPEGDVVPIFAHDARPAGAAVRGQTLDDVLVDAWEGLAAHRSVVCPVCQGAMRPRYGAATSLTPLGGRCDSCDSTLT